MNDPVALFLNLALGVTLYQLAKHLLIDGVQMLKKRRRQRREAELNAWRRKRQAGWSRTVPTVRTESGVPYLGLNDHTPPERKRV